MKRKEKLLRINCRFNYRLHYRFLQHVLIVGIFVFIFLMVAGQGNLQAETDKEIFDRARLALFDRQWDQAFGQLQRLTELYPNTSYYEQAQFYMGKCRQEKNDPIKALAYYNSFLSLSNNESLKEEAQIAIVDLNFQLYQSGKKGYIEKVVRFLDMPQRTLQYYAAFKLSYASNKSVAARAVPVLKRMVQEEKDTALVDRAKIALMRIGPEYVKQLSSSKNLENAMLFIRVTEKKSGKVSFSLNIPFALARLALDAMPEGNKKKLSKDGYDIEKLLQTVTKTKNFIRIDDKDELIEIGIE